MSHRMIAPCGLDCAKCDAYILTQADDRPGLEKLAEKWRTDYNAPNITVKDVLCDSCLAAGDRHCSHCSECEFRSCAMAKGLSTCAGCEQYACEKLLGFFQMVPAARENLDGLRH